MASPASAVLVATASSRTANRVMADRRPTTVQQCYGFLVHVLTRRHALSKWIPPALFAADAVLNALIIWKVPYTEIDWVAYMEQVAQFVGGERDYTKMRGGTGPLVYPAAHVYIYTGLYHLTDHGKDILRAQQLFAGLYMATLGLVMACYWRAGAPPYVFPLLVLSKRLHSIFVLRCFNDCFAVFFLWLAIFALQRRSWTLAAVLYSVGLGVKMTLLLVLPAVGVVLFLGRGFFPAIRLANVIVQLQVLLAVPFLVQNPWGYLGRAFEFSRQFLFKWTVNWRFVGEDMFLSRSFSVLLLALHVAVLAILITTRWLAPARKTLLAMIASLLSGDAPLVDAEERAAAQRVTPKYVLTTVLGANVVGMLFARSLHYQFYAYLAWATPFLLWRAGLHPVLQCVLWAAQEWAWNVYPSTSLSSAVVVVVLAVTVGVVWWGAREDWEKAKPDRATR